MMNAGHPEFDFDAPAREERSRPEATAETLERIKKLLRLGQSSNPHEAALAMQRAFELAQKHGVEVADLDLDECTERLTHEYFKCGQRVSFLRKLVLGIVTRFFDVEICLCAPRVLFVGRETAVAIAGYVYDFLAWAGTTELKAFCEAEVKARRKVNETKRKNFIQGFIYGIARQLNGAKAQLILDDSKMALVVAEKRRREAHLNELVPNQETKPIEQPKQHRTALGAGFARGMETRINQPLNGGGRREAMALTR